MVSSPPSKRQDLQGIRGIAILSVLGFHFYPTHFPNGYLGVDQFFVLSGFLMCMLLTKTEKLPIFTRISNFYARRLKRILPLYLLFISLTLLALCTVFPEAAVLQNQESAARALVFRSNRLSTGDEAYYEKLQVAVDLFTHTWSLSVEVQFYFVVPVVFLVGNWLSETRKYGFYIGIALTSAAFYSILPADEAFNSMFARIWQFLIGMLTFMLSNNSETFSGSRLKYVILLAMPITIAFPTQLPTNIVRFLFTILTASLMLISADDTILSNRLLTYIGDISYSLYLVHWPIYAFSKLTYGDNYYAFTGGLFISVLLAIIIFETFEKWYLQLANLNICVLIIAFFMLSGMLINKQWLFPEPDIEYPRLDGINSNNMTIEDVDQMNKYWNQMDLRSMVEPGCVQRTPTHKRWCDFELPGSKFKIAIFGNSYTHNHHKMFIQEFESQVYNVTMYSEKGCEPLAARQDDKNCMDKLTQFVEFIESAKPDYAFMFTRYFSIADAFENKTDPDLKNDRIFCQMKSQLNELLPNIKKKLYILDSMPLVNAPYIPKIAEDLRNGKSIQEISKSLLPSDNYKNGRLRHAALVKECGRKCELIDYLPLFFNKITNMYQYVDSRGFSYFTTLYHLSAHGIELVRPIYSAIAKSLK